MINTKKKKDLGLGCFILRNKIMNIANRILNKLNKLTNALLKKITKLVFIIFGLDPATGCQISNHRHKIEHLGTNYGGWQIPTELLDSKSVCYCVGAGEDVSFDCALAKKFGCEVYIFDPTPRAAMHFNKLVESTKNNIKMNINNQPNFFYEIKTNNLAHIHYYNYGVWSENGMQKFFAPKKPTYVSHSIIKTQNTDEYFSAECKTIGTIMKELGHSKIDLLKIDAEGAEYEIINSIIMDNLNIKIICLEFDEINFNEYKSHIKIIKTAKKILNAGYELVIADGPDYTFIKK